MYYSEPQMELLKVVRILGCLEKRQARALLRLRYGLALEAADSIIRQLKCDGKIKAVENTGLILSPDGKEDSCILRAVDIALCFAEPGNGPEILRASRIICCMRIIPITPPGFGSCMCRRGRSRKKVCW